jgi:hypothetical protein
MTVQGRGILKDMGITDLRRARDSDYNKHRKIIKVVTGEDY